VYRKLPDRRKSFTWSVDIGGTDVFLTCGLYEDGKLGEVFLVVGNGDIRLVADDWAILFSTAIQYGTPLDKLVCKFLEAWSKPDGQVRGHPWIKTCKGVYSFCVRALAIEFLGRMDLADVKPEPLPEKVAGYISQGGGF
jgi:ribonucleoside-diphosphate reductase alpha chain